MQNTQKKHLKKQGLAAPLPAPRMKKTAGKTPATFLYVHTTLIFVEKRVRVLAALSYFCNRSVWGRFAVFVLWCSAGAQPAPPIPPPPLPEPVQTMRVLALIFAAATLALAHATLRKEAAAGVLDARAGLTDGALSNAASGAGVGAGCSKNSDCSGNEVCGTGGKCGPCNGVGGGCQNDSQCCTKSCGKGKECSSCNGVGGMCNSDGDCCSGYYCNWDNGSCMTCLSKGAWCTYNEDCCSSKCSNRYCK